ncbi:methyltransferase TRM13-domain-containing protein [Dipodascopsis tothii]|uniref:methyltransferase TRM13-domain-containing protein n=1 Tax=Dipodascopsis tothii TaxID=44089 RepID=UPI0034CD5530
MASVGSETAGPAAAPAETAGVAAAGSTAGQPGQRALSTEPSRRTKKPLGDRLRCEYLMPHKKFKQCNMTRKASEQFCAQHLQTEPVAHDGVKHGRKNAVRIKCPVDPSHAIWSDRTGQHVKKCRARLVAAAKEEFWFSRDVNVRTPAPPADASPISADEYATWIAYVRRVHAAAIEGTRYGEVPLVQLDHAGLHARLDELSNKKHAIQQASLIAHMDQRALLHSRHTYIEFGAGRGELARYVHQALLQKHENQPPTNPSFLLIDRAGVRMKLDSKIIRDATELGSTCPEPFVSRIRTDIKDLDLGKCMAGLRPHGDGPASYVAISKHLCGAATDLTLRSFESPGAADELAGVAIALCCRHRCSYDTYPLAALGADTELTPRGFQILTRMCSWAVCGRRPATKKRKRTDEPDAGDDAHDADDADVDEATAAADAVDAANYEADMAAGDKHVSGLPIAERELIGDMARNVLDYGRVRYLESLRRDGAPLFATVELVRYVDRAISGENYCLLGVPVHRE